MKHTARISIIVKCAIAALAVATCAQAPAQGKAARKRLDTFCGFKAGESRQKLEKTVKTDPKTNRVKARTPFRKFKHVSLTFSDGGELAGVSVVANFDKMNFAAMKKELDECCRELGRFDGMEGLAKAEWVANGNGISKIYSAKEATVSINGETDIARQTPSGGTVKCAMLDIFIEWNLDAMRRNPLP